MIDGDYCEIAKWYEAREVVARKEHACCECKAKIRRGERHLLAKGRWSFGFEQYRQHLLCCEACELVRDEFNGSECIGFGTLYETWRNDLAWQYDRKKDKDRPAWKRLRSLIAKIQRRARR